MSTPWALQLYTVREEIKQDLSGTLRAVAGMGYTAVELGDLGQPPEEIRKMLDDLHLAVAGFHTGMENLEKDLARVADHSRKLGNRNIVVSSLPEPRRWDAAGWKASARAMSCLGEALAQEGMALFYHNHSFEFQKFDGRCGLDIFYAESDPKLVQAELDTYWVVHGGEDPAAYIERYRARLGLLHLKDMAPGQERAFAEVGEGILDWKAIFAAAARAQVEWYIVEQDRCARPALESARISFQNLERMRRP